MHLENFIIDANKPVHLAWWAEQFEVSEEALVAAIAAVGNGEMLYEPIWKNERGD